MEQLRGRNARLRRTSEAQAPPSAAAGSRPLSPAALALELDENFCRQGSPPTAATPARTLPFADMMRTPGPAPLPAPGEGGALPAASVAALLRGLHANPLAAIDALAALTPGVRCA